MRGPALWARKSASGELMLHTVSRSGGAAGFLEDDLVAHAGGTEVVGHLVLPGGSGGGVVVAPRGWNRGATVPFHWAVGVSGPAGQRGGRTGARSAPALPAGGGGVAGQQCGRVVS